MQQDYPASSTEPVCSRPVDAMTNDYRALCAELHAALEKHDLSLADDQLLDRSAAALRAALAQPEPEGPTDEELNGVMFQAVWECMDNADDLTNDEMDRLKARAVLAKWGNSQGILDSSPQPVAVSERLPGVEDCDEQGRCWWYGEGADMIGWTLDAEGASYYRAKFWLPANAIPILKATNAQ